MRIVVLLLCSLPLTTIADSLRSTRNQRLTEVSHRVSISVVNGLATATVQRTFKNHGKKTDEATLDIVLPSGAVATGLRIKGKNQWFKGELMHARKAEELYRELTGLGPSRPMDPALLYWEWTDQLALRVFPIFSGKTSTIEYTLTIPTEYEDGQYLVSYPRQSKGLAKPKVGVKGHRTVVVDDSIVNGNFLLSQKKPSKLATKLGFSDPYLLVVPMQVSTTKQAKNVSVRVQAKHTWASDLELTVIDPAGDQHSLSEGDMTSDDNDLDQTFELQDVKSVNGRWHLLVRDNHPWDSGTIEEWTVKFAGTKRTHKKKYYIPQPSEGGGSRATIKIANKRSKYSNLRFGKVDLVENKHFQRIEFDASSELSKLARKHRVVFVIDRSRTMKQEGVDAQLRLAKAYLANAPKAQFEIVLYDRRAIATSDSFLAANQFDAHVKSLRKSGKLVPANGSFLDRGLNKAKRVLAREIGSRHIVAFTDNRLRTRWKTAKVTQALRGMGGVVVHVAQVGGLQSDFAITRNDKHRLYSLSTLTGGVVVNVDGLSLARTTHLNDEAEYLVRPNRIDNVLFNGKRQEDSISEGQGIRKMEALKQADNEVRLSGQLWTREVSFSAKEEERLNVATAGFVFSHDLYEPLTDAEKFVVAMYGKAVSPVTSYLAVEPGVRPSTDGILRGSGSGFGAGGGRLSGLGGRFSPPPFDWKKLARRISKRCGVTKRTKAIVETNDTEIADVRLVSETGCISTELWKVMLPSHTMFQGDKEHELEILPVSR